MEIEQSRVVVRAKDFDATNRFYEVVLGLPRLQNWDSERGRHVQFQAGGMVIEVLGRRRADEPGDRDEVFEYRGPQHKMTIELLVPSAEGAYEELIFRDRNIPGGLREGADGAKIFETHDPDGVKIQFRDGG